jgi:hypothetical protein
VTFVTQPIKSMAPIDQAYTKMLNDIVLLIVGGIGGIVGKRAVGAVSNAINPPPVIPPAPAPAPTPAPATSTWTSSGALPAWVNPPLDETWVPPPPPTTPPEHLEPDHVREEIAAARREVGQ